MTKRGLEPGLLGLSPALLDIGTGLFHTKGAPGPAAGAGEQWTAQTHGSKCSFLSPPYNLFPFWTQLFLSTHLQCRFLVMPGQVEVHGEQGTTCPFLRATLLRESPAIRAILPEVPACWVGSCWKATPPRVPQLRNTTFHHYNYHGNPASLTRQPAQTRADMLQVCLYLFFPDPFSTVQKELAEITL